MVRVVLELASVSDVSEVGVMAVVVGCAEVSVALGV